MKRKNSILLVIIGALITINSVLFLSEKGTSVAFEEDMFAISDTTSVKSIQIGDVNLQKKNGWFVGQYPADPAFVDHLLNVLLRVRVKKPVGEMTKGGVPIKIDGYEPFLFAWNETKTKTFFVRDDQGYEMEIPGFTDYLGGIFELEVDQWRDRLVYDGSWRTIQNLALDYAADDSDDFIIQFEKDFFKISGVNKIDTTAMMTYLNQFEYFQANERISEGRIPAMDSLRKTQPIATLTIDDINASEPVVLKIFPRRSQDGFHLLLDPNGEMIAMDAPRTAQILLKKSDLAAKN